MIETDLITKIRGNIMENLTVKNFVNKLATSEPIPGGGSIAGLSAALGSALSSMVFSLTVGKSVYNELSEDDKDKFDYCYKETNRYVDKFLQLMEEDAAIFNEFIKVFAMPKTTEEEKQNRKLAMDEGFKNAMKTPIIVLEECERVYDIIVVAAELGNLSVISDAAVAVIMLHAAVESSIINIKINLIGIKDEEEKRKILAKCKSVLEIGDMKKNKIINIVEQKLK